MSTGDPCYADIKSISFFCFNCQANILISCKFEVLRNLINCNLITLTCPMCESKQKLDFISWYFDGYLKNIGK